MKKILIIMSIVLFLLIAACQNQFVSDDITGGVVGPVEYGETKEERQGAGVVTVKEFYIVANRNGFEPDNLEVNKGDLVRLVLYASNKDFTFVLPEDGINEFLEEDNYKTVEFVADQAGEFTFFSSIYSGPQSADLQGTLTVVE